jgi:thioredoxin-like negative regulator of GroEL
LRPDIDRLLRTYIRRNGTFRVRELLRAATPDVAWIVDLSAAAPVRSEFLLMVVREPWITPSQRQALYKQLLGIAELELASRTGEGRNDALWRLRDARLHWIESLLEAEDFAAAAAAIRETDAEERQANAHRFRRLELQIAAATGTLETLWARFRTHPDEAPTIDLVQETATMLRRRGANQTARNLLGSYYRLQLDQGSVDVSTFLGLAEVMLAGGERDPALALLQRMRIVSPQPFDALGPAARLLQRFGHTKDAQTFLELRVRAVPWDLETRTELATLNADTAQMRAIASDAQAPYALRAQLASNLKGASGLGSQELDLLASGQPVQPASAERPYFFFARLQAEAKGAVRVRLLRGALAIRPESTQARLALFHALRDNGAWAAAAGVFEPQLKNSLGEWLRDDASTGEPGKWTADAFLREYPQRAEIAMQLADAYRRMDRLGAARALLAVAAQITDSGTARTELAAIDSAVKRRMENRSRQPQIHDGLEQTVRVRPRLTEFRGER